MHCLRCKKKLKKATMSGLGPDCEKKGREEAEAFCLKTFGETREEFCDSCDSDAASDNGQTLEEYQSESGRSSKDLLRFLDSMILHGLWSRKRRV